MTSEALSLVDVTLPLRDLVPDLPALVARTDSPVYDAFYLALAERTGATLLTADLALIRRALSLGVV